MIGSALSFTEISKALQAADLNGMPTMGLSILRNIMLEPLVTYLRFEALHLGFNAEIRLGEYDNVLQDALGGETVYDERTDAILVFLHLEAISWKLARSFNELSEDQVRGELDCVRDYCKSVVRGLRNRTQAMILWYGFLPPLFPSLGIYDSQIQTGQSHAVQALNAAIQEEVRNVHNAYFVDLGLCLARVGAKNFLDNRYWHMNRAPYTLNAYQEIAHEAGKYLRPRFGKAKKCLVLDCDNTLWGGIIGEDGLAGIKLGESSPGSAYMEFQQQILDLHHRGVILAICSKNNEGDVWEVFDNHPSSVIRRRHIAAWRVNWRDKPTNIRELALELNIGLDSMVFIDDSDFEVNLVRQELPEVEVLHFPKEQAFHARDKLACCGLFDTLTVSAEDRKRGMMYGAEAERKQLLSSATDIKSYLKSLEMRILLCPADSFSIPRVAQQTQKTNQFNLTTKRYSEADIASFASDPNAEVLCIKLSDKFGDSGLVGSCILKFESDTAYIDTFLLSCRALGRGVEDVFLRHIARRARKRGASVVFGDYIPTRKNAQVQHFYKRHGFSPVSCCAQGDVHRFAFALDQPIEDDPDCYSEIITRFDI
ncbi:HAD-IIIC family phosphatase [Solidesulfovibrio sp.]